MSQTIITAVIGKHSWNHRVQAGSPRRRPQNVSPAQSRAPSWSFELQSLGLGPSEFKDQSGATPADRGRPHGPPDAHFWRRSIPPQRPAMVAGAVEAEAAVVVVETVMAAWRRRW
jgi:hypothetical protein